MPSEPDRLHTRLLLAAALLVVAATVVWALRTPVAPNADRYDYLGRAHHVLEGVGPRPMVAYPLRFAFEGATPLPPENLTRPPLWPVLLAPGLRLGLGETTGVWVAALGLLTLLPLVALAGDRAFGPGAGGFAALALATSFATARALAGAGPELWIALLLAFVWTWNPRGNRLRSAGVLGAAMASMAWLHPIGALYAGLGFAARIGRTAPRTLALAAGIGLVLGLPWYVQAGAVTGSPLGPLQSQAEIAKSLYDAGGLGPYRTLDPAPSVAVIAAAPGAWLHHWAWNMKEQALGLDGWLAWTLVPLALLGVRRDPRLAGRDALLGLAAFAAVGAVALDPRLLVPILPVACTWAGAGYRVLAERRPAWFGVPVALILALAPWILPLGRTAVPGQETADLPARLADPPQDLVVAAGNATGPLFVDSSVLAWRARRPAIFVPEEPAVLETLRTRDGLRGDGTLVLAAGTDSRWIDARWDAWIAERSVRTVGDAWIVDAAAPAPPAVYVPEALALGPADVPDSLVTLDVPPASRAGIRVTAATARALERLLAAAAADGIQLWIVSGYRSFQRQQRLHDRAIERHGADQRWVAAPGTSEHQLGTTVDFADAALRHAVEPSFGDTPEGRWLSAHAETHGFVRSYTEANADRTGYRPEPWHYRYRPELFEDPPGGAEPGAPR